MPAKIPGLGMWDEFKNFAFKGNMIDLAVGVILGAAFGAVVTSMVKNIIMPVISYVTPHLTFDQWHLGKITIGNFLNDLLNFLIQAVAIFLIVVKVIGALMKKAAKPPPPPGEPAVKECPFCLSQIPFKARKCGHCTADLPAEGAAAPAIA
jgi:large conductance mechanosensitive channel